MKNVLVTVGLFLGASFAQEINTEGFPIVDEPITLTMMGSKAAIQAPWEDMAFFTEMEALTNIRFTFDTPPAESYQERLNLVFASNDLPDVLFGAALSPQQEVTLGSQGQLIPLEGLIEQYAPNFSRMMQEDPELARSITAPDGHIYALPFIDGPRGFGPIPRMWINRVWLETLDLDTPDTVEDFYNVLKAFRENDPDGNGQADEIVLSATTVAGGQYPTGFDLTTNMLNAFGFTGTVDVQEGTVRYAPVEDGYRAYLAYMNRLYREGLLDQEAFSQSSEQITAKGNEGRLGSFTNIGAFIVVGVERQPDYAVMTPLTSAVNDQKFVTQFPRYGTGTFAITSSNPQPEATMRWVDYFYSREGALFAALGIEGNTFRYIDGGKGYEPLAPEGLNQEEHRGSVTPDVGTQLPRRHDVVQELEFYKYEETNPLNAYIQKETEEKQRPYVRDAFPIVRFTAEELNQLNFLNTDINSFVSQQSAAFIIGREPLNDETWATYQQTLERIGVTELVRLHQAAYDRWERAGAPE